MGTQTEDLVVAQAEHFHRICTWLREETHWNQGGVCQKCPMSETTDYGPAVRGCVLTIQELIELCQTT